MTQLHVYAATSDDTASAVRLLDEQIPPSATAAMVLAFYGRRHHDAALHRYLSGRFPRSAVLGGTSAGGLMTHRGVLDECSIGVLLIDDADGSYGVAAGRLVDDPAQLAEELLHQALASCGSTGELPELIWVYQAPGNEERVIEGLRRVVGDRCPIIGGSSADDDLTGKWGQVGPAGMTSDGLVVGVLFPSTPIGFAFQGGYEPAGPSGVVTGIGYRRADGDGVVTETSGRRVVSIDGRPAAEVYNRWIDGRLDDKLASGGTILTDTTLCPIATDAVYADGVATYLLIHPESIAADGSLTTFREVEVGSRVYAMRGDRGQLVNRARRVAEQAQRSLPGGTGTAGAIIVYCGGCKLAIGDEIASVAAAVGEELGGAPFIGCFTYGEQGRLADRNVHGNLMISAIAFGR